MSLPLVLVVEVSVPCFISPGIVMWSPRVKSRKASLLNQPGMVAGSVGFPLCSILIIGRPIYSVGWVVSVPEMGSGFPVPPELWSVVLLVDGGSVSVPPSLGGLVSVQIPGAVQGG